MQKFPFLKQTEDVWAWARRLVALLNELAAQQGVPTGSLIESELATAPPGWLVCDGSSYTSEQYPALYIALSGMGGTFNVPNYVPTFGQTVMIKD